MSSMESKVAKSFEEYLSIESGLDSQGRIYRGVVDICYELIPKVGRKIYSGGYSLDAEKFLLQVFKDRAVSHIHIAPANDLEWLALAQHHGLPTRLLDWTVSPLVALFFAAINCHTKDGVVYTRHMSRGNKGELKMASENPFDIKKPLKYYPPHMSPRIPAQHALFTLEPKPTIPTDASELLSIRIPASQKATMIRRLYELGVTHESLFPDLDGTCAYWTWRFQFGIGYWPKKRKKA